MALPAVHFTYKAFVLPRRLEAGQLETKKWVISESSTLSVNGTTNINKFTCEILAYDKTDTLTISKSSNGVILSGNVGLSIKSFDCHNSIMTHDLRKTLKEDQYPNAAYQLFVVKQTS